MKSASALRWIVPAFVLGASLASAATPISVVNNTTLSFGRFAAGSGGTVTISPAGARSQSGGVVLISSETGFAARFTVSGDVASYSIVLPANGTVSLKSPGGQVMALNNFTSSPSGIGTIGGGGSQSVTVGATLSVSSSQTPGTYTGTFDMTVDYN